MIPTPPNALCQRPKITSSAANARMPVTAPKKISERSRMRMLSRQLNCDRKNFTIRTPRRSPQNVYYLLTLSLAEAENMVNARKKFPKAVHACRSDEARRGTLNMDSALSSPMDAIRVEARIAYLADTSCRARVLSPCIVRTSQTHNLCRPQPLPRCKSHTTDSFGLQRDVQCRRCQR
jgi:hypothetical protein